MTRTAPYGHRSLTSSLALCLSALAACQGTETDNPVSELVPFVSPDRSGPEAQGVWT